MTADDLASIAARLRRAEERLAQHDTRISTLEVHTAAGDARLNDYAYEIDILTRIALRSARRIDAIERREPTSSATGGHQP
jgi:hypothetical protein